MYSDGMSLFSYCPWIQMVWFIFCPKPDDSSVSPWRYYQDTKISTKTQRFRQKSYNLSNTLHRPQELPSLPELPCGKCLWEVVRRCNNIRGLKLRYKPAINSHCSTFKQENFLMCLCYIFFISFDSLQFHSPRTALVSTLR